MKIGKLKKVDIRELWKGEASDFTPWLAQEDNIAQLGEEIGVELEVIEQEKSVGPFRADILCKSTIDDHYVLVENQLEKTDHTHLGQILTYAAGLDAVSIIWIAKKFTEEHRATIDWLNRITIEQFNFFGIEIEAYQIGESMPAPMFQIVSKPNDWSKSVKIAAASQTLTEAQTLYLEYWTEMRNYFEKQGTFLKHQKPQTNHWTSFAVGKSYFVLTAIVSVRDNSIRVSCEITSSPVNEDFRKLKNKYEEDSYIQIDDKIVWDEMPDKKVSIIYLKRNADVKNRDDWNNQHLWIMETLEKFDKFFRLKIKQL